MGNGTIGSDTWTDRIPASRTTGVTSQEARSGCHDREEQVATPDDLCRARQLPSSADDNKVEIALDPRPQRGWRIEWHARYIVHIRTSPLWDALHELKDMSLACDCPVEQLCEADLLIELYFDAMAPGGDPGRRGTDGKWSRAVTLLQGIQAIPKGVALPMMSQEAPVLAFRKLFPEHWFRSYKFAMVEDLINSPPFCCYAAWLAERGEAWDGPLVPHLAAGSVRQLARIGDGCQVGAMTHKAALPPLLVFNLEPDDHFQQAFQRAQRPLPYEDLPVSDMDLEFVADAYASPAKSLRPWRQQAVGALCELKRRWEGVTLHLRSFQETAVQQVTKHRDMGLLALLMVLTSWADTSFPFGLICGLPAVGYAPPYMASFPSSQLR